MKQDLTRDAACELTMYYNNSVSISFGHTGSIQSVVLQILTVYAQSVENFLENH